MTEVLESSFAIQKRGGRWCLIHAESGIMHDRNFAHKGMAKAFGLELTEQGYVPAGAGRVSAILDDEPPPEGAVVGEGAVPPLKEEDVLLVDEDGPQEEIIPPDEEITGSPGEEVIPEDPAVDYKTLGFFKLKVYASSRGVEVTKKSTKADILAALETL